MGGTKLFSQVVSERVLSLRMQTPPIGEEGSVAGGREEPEGGALRSAPSAPATQFPSQEGPGKASARGKLLWSRSVKRMTLAHALIRHPPRISYTF